MTREEFYETIPKDGWKLDGGGMIRRTINRTIYNGKSVECFECPITAVYNDTADARDIRTRAGSAYSVGPLVGLSSEDSLAIIGAADNPDTIANAQIRVELERALGLPHVS